MAEEPPPLIVRLVYRDAINPGLEAALAAEMADIAKDFEKHFLDGIAGIAGIVQQAERQVVDRLLEARDQRFIAFLFACAQLGDQFFILAALLGGVKRAVGVVGTIRIQAEHGTGHV